MARLVNLRPDVEVEPYLAEHLLDLKIGNQRPRSIRERRLTVLRVARALGHPLADVTRDELRAWQATRAHLSPAGMHNEVVHVACYLKWLVKREIRPEDPSPVLVRPRNVHKRNPTPIPDESVVRALQTASQPMHAWLQLASSCGLRCCEIAPLEREDIIDGPNPALRITGKGGKERKVSLPPPLRDELLAAPFPPAGPLFARMDGKPGPPSATRVSERINKYLHAYGIPYTAHKLRHRFGTKLYEATRDPFLVAEVMGHASIETTRGYVRLVDDRAAAAIASIHLVA